MTDNRPVVEGLPPPLFPPHAELVRCRACGNMVGLTADGFYWGQHQNRTTTMCLPGRIRCDRKVRDHATNKLRFCDHETIIDKEGRII